MADLEPKRPRCPRCGSAQVALCGESVQYAPEAYLHQPIPERELRTRAYQCDCGLGFTVTVPSQKSGNS